jgi:putative membrane protein
VTPEFSWTSWHGDWTLRVGLGLLVWLYFVGIGPLRRRYRLARRVDRRQVATFLGGVALLFVALEGPLHDLSDHYLFSAHMVQHMLLVMFAPPLLIMGTPGWLLRPLVGDRRVHRVALFVTSPLIALLIFNVPFTASHFPLFYQRTLEDHGVHVAEHLIFLVAAVITWWPLLSTMPELPRLSYPLQMVYVFAQTFSGFIVGAFLTNAPRPLYTFYAEAPRVFGLTPLDDQRLGGLLMWVGGGFFYLLVFTAVFFAWVRSEGVADDVAPPPRGPANKPIAAAIGPNHIVPASPDPTRLN